MFFVAINTTTLQLSMFLYGFAAASPCRKHLNFILATCHTSIIFCDMAVLGFKKVQTFSPSLLSPIL